MPTKKERKSQCQPTLIIVAAVAILIILLATASYKVCPADRVMVITGPGGRRFVSGGSAFIIPFIMRVDWLSLGAVQSLLRTDTPIPTKDAILIDVNAVANFQIASETMTVDENGKQVKALENAAKNYLNQSKERMEKDVTQVLLGKLREVIGKTELKELMENRDTFAATVAESARVDMERLGLQLTTFNIQDFTDRQNVIANMGAEMAAEISRNAKLASINAEQDVAVRQNQLDLKRAELQSISDKAQAEADAVKGITAAEQSKTLKVKEQEAEIAAAEKKAVLEQKNAEIEEQKLNATIRKKADADRYAAEQQADAQMYTTQKHADADYTEEGRQHWFSTSDEDSCDQVGTIITPTTTAKKLGSISGLYWEDTNKNGIQDEGENTHFAGQTVILTDENGKQLATTKTDKDGKYIFERLDANGNKYRIQFTKVNHRDFTTPDVGDKTPAADGSSTDSDAYTDEANKLTITLTQDAPTKEHVDAGVLPETWLATMPHTGMGLLLPLLMLVSISGLVAAIILLRKKEEQ